MASARTKIRVFRQDGTPVAEYLLGEGVHSMGRDPSSAIYLESDYVSGEHARLHLSATGIEIEDLNSTSGTYLDGVTVRGKLDIQPGQKIQIGDLQVDLTVEGAGEVAAAATLGAGRYTLVQELGRGAMGTVWLATDNELQEEVAIKLLAPELAGDAVTLADLKREVQKSRRLSHEHIVRIHDLSNLPGELPFITMEFIRGSNMDAVRLNQPDGLMSWKHLRSVVVQLAEALDYAHRQKIVHRDLKPANMMVTEDYTLKLADFGIAATLNDATARSSLAGTVSGTLTYMSPQQLQGEDPRGSDDIYSLGATLYNLIAGRPPFKSGDVQTQILNQSPTPLTQVLASAGVVSDIPDYVSSLVMACLAKDPKDRPQSGKAIVEWIVSEGRSELIAGKETTFFKGTAPAAVPPKPPPPGAPAKRNKKLVIGIAVAAIVGLGYWVGLPLMGLSGDPSITVIPADQSVVADIGTLKQGELIGNNRPYKFTEIPKELAGLNFVRMECQENGDYEYNVLGECKVYALIVAGDGSKLIREGWKKTEYTVGTLSKGKTGLALVYEKIVSKGKYEMKSSGSWAYMLGSRIPIKIGEPSSGEVASTNKPGTVLWEFETRGWVASSPAIGPDGTLYVGSHDTKIYALDGATGARKWEFKTGNNVNSCPAIGSDGTVYFGSVDKKVYALDGKTGVKRWEFVTDEQVWSSPTIGPDGTVYIGSNDNKLYALNGATGAKKWEFETGGKIGTISPAIGADGTVYFGSDDNKIYALDGKTGTKKWEFETGDKVSSSPAVGFDGTVYFGSWDRKVYALDGKSGAQKWSFMTRFMVTSSPAIGSDGTVYIGSRDSNVYALNGKTGAKKWAFLTRSPVGSGPAIGDDGTVYVGSEDKKVYALDGATGTKKWEFETGESKYGVRSSPVIGPDGTIYIGSYDKKVYAIKTTSKGPAKSPWPMRGQNAQHTGRK